MNYLQHSIEILLKKKHKQTNKQNEKLQLREKQLNI